VIRDVRTWAGRVHTARPALAIRAAGVRAGWPVAIPLAGPIVAYLVLRQPALGWPVLLALVAVPVALTRPDGIAVAVLPMSVISPLSRNGTQLLVAMVAVYAVGAVVVRWAAVPVAAPAPLGWPHAGVVGLLAVLLASSTERGYAPPGQALASDFIGMVAGLVLLALVIAAPPAPGTAARVLVLTGGLAAGYALLSGSYDEGRLTGLGLGTNYLGALLALPLAAGVGLARARGIAWLVPAAPCLVVVVQTHSRGALVAAAAGVAVAVISGRRRWVQAFGTVAALAAGAVCYLVANPLRDIAFGTRAASELSANSAVRAEAARVAFDVALAHPVRGIGYGMFPFYAMTDPRLGIYINTHDDYLRLAAEAGVAALLLFLAVLVAGLTAPGAALVPLRAAVVAGAVALLFANTLSDLGVEATFWVCLGCLLAHRRGTRTRPPSSTKEKIDA
jgi:O-antigen ligase